MEAMDIQAVESKLSDVTVTAIPMSGKNVHKDLGHGGNSHATISTVPASSPSSVGKDKDNGTSKYAQLLAVIEEMEALLQSTTLHRRMCELWLLSKIEHYVCVMSWNTKWRWDTGYSADSVEWCPVEGYREVLVCGTYQLDKKEEGVEQTTKQKRLGRIYLFVINSATTELSPIQTVDTAGVLDQKWCYHLIQGSPVLAVVTSEGFLQLYKLLKEDGIYNLEPWISYKIDQDILALSVDWSTNRMNSNEIHLVVSDSSGSVTVVKVQDGLHKVGAWKAHDYEAWIVGFNYWNPEVFYSGGDDCCFKCYDTRLPDMPVSVNRSHEAGVTSIRSHVEVEHQLLTGSYDEKIRLWDARQLKRSIAKRDVNGGVWRLKWHPHDNNTVLAACMYGGFRIVTVKDDIDVVSEYLEHDSIAYGADWKCSEDSMVATCSFYDCKLHICEIVM